MTRWPAALPRGMEGHLLPSLQEALESQNSQGRCGLQELLGPVQPRTTPFGQHSSSSSCPTARPGSPFTLRGRMETLNKVYVTLQKHAHSSDPQQGSSCPPCLPTFSKVLRLTEHFSTRIQAQGAGRGEKNVLCWKA